MRMVVLRKPIVGIGDAEIREAVALARRALPALGGKEREDRARKLIGMVGDGFSLFSVQAHLKVDGYRFRLREEYPNASDEAISKAASAIYGLESARINDGNRSGTEKAMAAAVARMIIENEAGACGED